MDDGSEDMNTIKMMQSLCRNASEVFHFHFGKVFAGGWASQLGTILPARRLCIRLNGSALVLCYQLRCRFSPRLLSDARMTRCLNVVTCMITLLRVVAYRVQFHAHFFQFNV